MPRGRLVTAAEVERMLALRAEGLSCEQISAATGRAAGHVSNLLYRAEHGWRPKGLRLTDEVRERILSMRGRSTTLGQIMLAVGLGGSTVEKVLAEAREVGDLRAYSQAARARLEQRHVAEPSGNAASDGGGMPHPAPVVASMRISLPPHVQRARESLRRYMPDADATREAIRLYQRENEGSGTVAAVAPVVRPSSKPFKIGSSFHAPSSHGDAP